MAAADSPPDAQPTLRVAGRPAGGAAGPTPEAEPPPPPRSVPVPGGGYDRVGGSRLTGTGAVLLAIVIFLIASPPTTVETEVVAVVWATLAGILVVGVAAPLVLVRQVQIEASSPRDATVGEIVPIAVTVSGRSAGLEIRALDPTGDWYRAAAPGLGHVGHLADTRGLFRGLRVEARVTAPLGILAAHRVYDVMLPYAVEVAPRPLSVAWLPAPAPVETGPLDRTVAALSGDLVRSVRPYASGDAPRLVHWPSSARLGELVVRELEPPAPVGQAVALDLRDLGPDTERAASYALGACRAVLATGGHLLLATCEAGGPVVGRVRSQVDAGRRLARAVPGRPGIPPEGWPVVEIGR